MKATNKSLQIGGDKSTQGLPLPPPPPSVTSTITLEQQGIIDDLTTLSNTIIAREAEIMALKDKWANNDYTLPEDETNENRLRFLSHITRLTNPQSTDLETLLDGFDGNVFIENIGGHNRTYYADISRRLDYTRQLLFRLREPVRIFQEEIEPLMVQFLNKKNNSENLFTSYTLKDDQDEDEEVESATFFDMLLYYSNSYRDALDSPIRFATTLNSDDPTHPTDPTDPMEGALKAEQTEISKFIAYLTDVLIPTAEAHTTSGGRKRKANKTKRAKKTKGAKKTKRANDRKTRSNKIKGGNDDEVVEQIEKIIDKVEKGETLTADENTLISTHLHGIVTDEITLRTEMYNDAINAQYQKIHDINTQGDDDDDINKEIAKCIKRIKIHTTTRGRLEQFARANSIPV